LRCERGFNRIKTRPALPVAFGPPAPTDDMKDSTLGSLVTISATWRWCLIIPSNEMSCAASVVPKI
jgi:hypothetical protein